MKRVPCCRQCGDYWDSDGEFHTGRRASPALGFQFCTQRCAAQWALWNAEEATGTEWNPNTDEWETKGYDDDLELSYWYCDSDEFHRKYYEDWPNSRETVENYLELKRKAEEEGKDW